MQCLTTDATPGSCTVTNANRTVHQGVEAGFGVSVFRGMATTDDRIWINVAYTYNDFFFDGDARFGNNRLPGAPPHYLRGELLYKHPNGFYAGPNVEWVPESYFVDNTNTTTTKPYALLNFRVGYDRGDGLSAYLEGRNLTDERYIASASIAQTANAASALFEPGALLAALALVGVGTAFAVSGHAASAAPQLLTRPAVFLHGVSVAFWVGALIPLMAAMRDTENHVEELQRFSRVIPGFVAVLVVSGLCLSVIQLGTFDALWTTDYGLVLLGKLAAVHAAARLAPGTGGR